MQAFIAGYSEISLIKSASERRNHFEPETDGYYNRKANTSSANTIGNDTGRTGRNGIIPYFVKFACTEFILLVRDDYYINLQ